MSLEGKTVLVTGASGFVGTNLVNKLQSIDCELLTPSSSELDLTNEKSVNDYFASYFPTVVLHIAGKVGGILANKTYPGEFFHKNAMMSVLVGHYAWLNGAEKVVSLAAGWGYP